MSFTFAFKIRPIKSYYHDNFVDKNNAIYYHYDIDNKNINATISIALMQNQAHIYVSLSPNQYYSTKKPFPNTQLQ
jgi:hypothetical protein